MTARILIAEDDASFRGLLGAILSAEGYQTVEAADGLKAHSLLRNGAFDLVVTDLKMPGMTGLELFRHSRGDVNPPPFILLTAFGTIEQAVGAMKEGVADFLTKPLKDPQTLRELVAGILGRNLREREYLTLKETEAAGIPPEDIIYAGAAMGEVRRLIDEVAASPATVLVTGESGTGKELAARMVHLKSPRKNAGFVAVNCAAIPENLMESELFGHEKGAFTGAAQQRIGKFELARGGTLFLDEIGELPLQLQAKLLRVLQERVFERVGGTREIRADVRIVAATNRDLPREVAARRFREDLFYRINVFPVSLPALRDRSDALASLVPYLTARCSRLTGKKSPAVSPAAMEALRRHDWPGNIRELQNVIERAVILAKGVITPGELPDVIRARPTAAPPNAPGLLRENEHDTIRTALKLCGGNRRLAAEKLGISRRTLQYRLKEYGLIDGD